MKDDFSESSIKIGNQNELRDGNIVGNNNQVILNKQNNSSVSYEGDRENVYFLNRMSPLLIQKFGEKKLRVLDMLSLISSIITICLWANSFTSTTIIPFVPRITFIKPEWIFLIFILLTFLTVFLYNVVEHRAKTQCKNCKEEFAYGEYKDPFVEEIETSRGTRKTTIRYYKCRFCGDTQQVKIKTLIPKEKNL